MKMLSSIVLFATFLWYSAAAPMPVPGAGPVGNQRDGPGPAADMDPPGMYGFGMGPFNASSACHAAINSTCTTCPASRPGAGTPPTNAPPGWGRGPVNSTCFACMTAHSDALIAAGCDHLKCPASIATKCPGCPRHDADDSCKEVCFGKRSSQACTDCRNKCRECVATHTNALITAGCTHLACNRAVDKTCPACTPNDACPAACDKDRNGTDCKKCDKNRVACGECRKANNAALVKAGCQPQGPQAQGPANGVGNGVHVGPGRGGPKGNN